MAASDDPHANRPKRVRTGCLTCRERHLKCDEAAPDCMNCRKSNRVCKRGVRLNFIDTQVKPVPTLPKTDDWHVSFQDESREIASDYAGGAARYPPYPRSRSGSSPKSRSTSESISSSSTVASSSASHTNFPPILPPLPSIPINETSFGDEYQLKHRHSDPYIASSIPTQITPPLKPIKTEPSTQMSMSMSSIKKAPPLDFIDSQERTLFMQVFVEEVGIWMDSLDPQKHFSRLLPFTSLEEPMLLNAFLACGARHLTLVNAQYAEDRALNFYDTATRLLLNALQSDERDMVTCATTAVILNVYEIMSERAQQRMNHIAGARALIKECGWSARSTGVGGACFWLNVSMELLSCLHFNWTVAWNPDEWGVDMDFTRNPGAIGQEDLWAHRMVYILAKVANFRATIKAFDSYDEQVARYEEWKDYRDLCISWNEKTPRSMHPMAYLYPYQTNTKSAFPEVWLIKRCTVVARMFFHTAMVLLAGINPMLPRDSPEMSEMAMEHAHQICGITAHVKDRGVASAALRSLAIAAECLVNRKEQEEVLLIFQKIKRETGWRVDFVYKELKQIWGWGSPESTPSTSTMSSLSMMGMTTGSQEMSTYATHHPQQSPSHEFHAEEQQRQQQRLVLRQQQQHHSQQQQQHQPHPQHPQHPQQHQQQAHPHSQQREHHLQQQIPPQAQYQTEANRLPQMNSAVMGIQNISSSHAYPPYVATSSPQTDTKRQYNM